MIYAAFALWFFIILFMAVGVRALWARLVKPVWVAWALLPGTIVSEMAFILGSLITGGEIRHAKILPSSGNEGDTEAQAEPRLKIIGPTIASILAVAACCGGIIVSHQLLGQPFIREFIFPNELPLSAVPKSLPTTGGAFWDMLAEQARLLQRMSNTIVSVDWLNWRVPLFVYLTICFSLRLCPGRRDLRFTLLAVLVLTALIGLAGVFLPSLGDLMGQFWPLLTYIWTLVLYLLAVSLVIWGAVALVGVLRGRSVAG